MNILSLAVQNKHVEQKIYCVKGDDSADIFLKGVISSDYGVSADDLRAAFAMADGAPVVLHVNSPGGSVFEGREMQSIIAAYSGKVTSVIEGIAASAATFVALSASEVQMVKGSRFMIHNGMAIAGGNKKVMKDMYDLLDGFDTELAAEYAAKTNLDASQISQWMDDETWFTSDQALQHGFVDKINPNTQNVQALQQWNLAAYANAPQALLVPPEPEPVAKQADPLPSMTKANTNKLALIQVL